MHTNRAHFSKIRALFCKFKALFFYFQKRARETSPFPVASCAPDPIRKYCTEEQISIRISPNCSQSSRPEVFYEKPILKNSAKFAGKHVCQSFFFNQVAGLRPATLLKKRLRHRWFPVIFIKFLTTHNF